MAKSQLPDAILVDKYVAGDENALAILINRHQSKIYGYIYSKVSDRDVTEDIFQETFFKVIHTLKSKKYYNEEGKFLSWVLRIASNLIIDKYRNDKKMPLNRDTDELLIFSRITDDSLNFDKDHLKIFSREVLKMISNGTPGWENLLPKGISDIIKQHQLFGYDPNKVLEKA